MTLFRPAALSARETHWLGKIVMVQPLSLSLLSCAAIGMAVAVGTFLYCASYTERTTVTGRLMPLTGLVNVFVPQSGIVVSKQIVEGQAVREGQTLYVLSGERRNAMLGETQAGVSREIALRRESLREELDKMKQVHAVDLHALRKRVQLLESEVAELDSQMQGQSSLIKLAEDALTRNRDLLNQHFISREQYQRSEASLLEQRLRLKELERDRLAGTRDLDEARSLLDSLPLRQQNQLAQLERILSTSNQELGESEAKRRLLITAPVTGTATAIAAEQGQTVDAGTPLVALIPAGSALQAELYAPSRAIGFIRPGQSVQLRYQAYPYQKFGHASGTVKSVTKTALGSGSWTEASAREPVYRVTVALTSQTMQAYGQAQPLQAGMAVDADILLDRRRLYEWVLQPIYSMTGRLQGGTGL